MLQFFSASTRMVNTKRGVSELMEASMGDHFSDADLLFFHSSIGHNFQEILDQAKEMAPNARILAASCCGVVGKEGVSESMKDIALMAIKGTEFKIASTDGIFGYNSYVKSKEMAHSLKSQCDGINMIYFLASGIDIDDDACIRGMEEVFGSEVTIFGATSADNMKGFVNYQGVDDKVTEHGAFMVGFCDPSLKVDTQATHGFVAVGEPLVVTKSTGNIIEEFNNKPAWEEYLNRLGLPTDSTCGDSIPIGALGEKLSPELAKEYGNEHLLRVVTKHEGSHMHYATTCPVGTELWLTKRDEDLIFSEMDRMVNDMVTRIGEREVVAVFHADCLARGRFLFNRIIKEELVGKMQTPFYVNGECPPWLGMYGFGEFARLGGKNTYHNYTTALYVIYRG
ncbi:MAG: FIST C-terminal domain-containing protein [Crocinitomicaceae bacterium]|nr:FIST C-terminal domain-containing protein [Crocinitomicaceae bacterium]MCF8444796.1 FIST C-terminal domain-containing protein [Crocinitomicaceae bacterium]